jgi:hypothetical protein
MKASPDKIEKNNDDDNDDYKDNYEFLGAASLMDSHNYREDDQTMKSPFTKQKIDMYLVPADTNNHSPDDNEDQLLTACNRVKFQVESFNFPDCGNLRTNKKKDVRLRLKCISAMLKQRQKDVEYRA